MTACLLANIVLLCCVCAVAKRSTKESSKHDNKDAVDTFYNLKCPGNSLKTILIAAGYEMKESDSWKDTFVQGRGLYTLERIQQESPEVWRLISDELVPGLEAWVTAVKARGSHGLEAFERVNSYQALLQWELLAAFLQDSAHHFFEHRNSPVFLQLPIFHNPVFTDWLLGEFRSQGRADLEFLRCAGPASGESDRHNHSARRRQMEGGTEFQT